MLGYTVATSHLTTGLLLCCIPKTYMFQREYAQHNYAESKNIFQFFLHNVFPDVREMDIHHSLTAFPFSILLRMQKEVEASFIYQEEGALLITFL